MLLFSLCRWPFWFCLLYSPCCFWENKKSFLKRLEGLKEEVKARLFLATIPPAENTAAVEMRKRLMCITGYHVNTAVLRVAELRRNPVYNVPAARRVLLPQKPFHHCSGWWLSCQVSNCSADTGCESDDGTGAGGLPTFTLNQWFREQPPPLGGSFKEQSSSQLPCPAASQHKSRERCCSLSPLLPCPSSYRFL